MNQREDLTVLGRFTKILYRKKVKRGGEKGRSFGDQGQFGVDPLPSVPGSRYRRSAAEWARIHAELLALAEGYEARIRAAVACIDRLPEPARTVERLYWIDGLPVQRIADQLYYSERNIRRIHQAAVAALAPAGRFRDA